MHEMGVSWGDGKTSSVIVDEEDDAWPIDLAGGYTEGWVDEELADRVEGDEQAVRRIIEFLSVEDGNCDTFTALRCRNRPSEFRRVEKKGESFWPPR